MSRGPARSIIRTAAGDPILEPPGNLLHWNLKHNYIKADLTMAGVQLTLCRKRIEDLVHREARGLKTESPVVIERSQRRYFNFKGWRPQWVHIVTAGAGKYQIETWHKGTGNFIVYWVDGTKKRLVANEIDAAYEIAFTEVIGETRKVSLLVKECGGPWEISVQKLDQ